MGKVPIVTVGLVALKALLSRDTAMAECSALEQERRAEIFYVNFSLTEKKKLYHQWTAKHLLSSCYSLERDAMERQEQEHEVEEDGLEAILEKYCE